MGNVYRVGSMHGTEYFATAREADRCRPGGEEPESVTRLNAATECGRLRDEAERQENLFWAARSLLDELAAWVPSMPDGLARRIDAFLTANPLPAVTCADRDGQRSYGV